MFVALTLLFGCEFVSDESSKWVIQYGVSKKNTPYCIKPDFTRGFNNDPWRRECIWLCTGRSSTLRYVEVAFHRDLYGKWRYSVRYDEKNQ